MHMKILNPNTTGPRRHYDLDQYEGIPGIYVIRKDQVFYVGSTKNLRARLREWTRFFPGARYEVLPTKNYREAEQKILQKLKNRCLPIVNINNPQKQPYRKKVNLRKQKRKHIAPPPAERYITRFGVTRTLGDWCQKNKIEKGHFYARIHLGWSEQDAIMPRGFRR